MLMSRSRSVTRRSGAEANISELSMLLSLRGRISVSGLCNVRLAGYERMRVDELIPGVPLNLEVNRRVASTLAMNRLMLWSVPPLPPELFEPQACACPPIPGYRSSVPGRHFFSQRFLNRDVRQ
jgi:hypothetical protein